MVEFEDAASERMAQLEQEDLERYQRDLEMQRTIVQMRRPIQRFEMRVQDYYRRFCAWKEDMISVGYPDDESRYIDYFIGDLQWHIKLRVLERRSSLCRLTDAYYEAHHHEVMIRLDEFIKNFRAANEIDEMVNQTTIEIQRADDNCILVEEESMDNSQQAESDVENLKENICEPYVLKLLDEIPSPLSIEMKEGDVDSDGAGACDEQHLGGNHFTDNLLPISVVKYAETELNEGNKGGNGVVTSWINGQPFLGSSSVTTTNVPINGSAKAWVEESMLAIKIVSGKYVIEDDAYKVFGEMTQEIQAALFDKEVINLSAKYTDFEKLLLFDPGGNRKCEMSFSKDVARLLFKGIIPSLRHTYLLTDTWKIHCLSSSYLKVALNLFTLSTQLSTKQNISSKGLGKWDQSMVEFKEATMEMMFGGMMLQWKDEKPSTCRAFAMNELMAPYIRGFNSDQLTLFDPGGKNCVLSMWNSWGVLSWNCCFMSWRCTRTFDDFHIGALAQRCITYDQPRLNDGHGISAGNATVHFTAAGMPSLILSCEDKYCFIGFNHFRTSKSDNHAIIPLKSYSIAYGDYFSESLFEEANSMSLSKFSCYRILSLDILTIKLDLMTSFDSWIGLLSPLRAEFSWDPGICAIFVYILEDKDDLKWVGNDIILIDDILLIMSIRYNNSSQTHSLTNSSGTSNIEVSLAWLVMLVDLMYLMLEQVINSISGPISFICVSRSSMLLPLTLILESLPAMNVTYGGIHWCLCDELDVHYSKLACSPYNLRSGATTVLELFNTVTCCSFRHIGVSNALGRYGDVSFVVARSFQLETSIGRCVLIPRLRTNFEEFNDSLHVVFSICPEDEQDIKMAMMSRVVGNIEMASLHYLDGTIDMGDGNVLATIYHSFEFYLAAIVKSMVLVNLKGFVWDPGKDLYGICKPCKVESLVAFGKYFDMKVTTSTIIAFVTKAVRCGVASLELRGSNSPTYSQWLDSHERYNIWVYGEEFCVSKWSLQRCRIKPRCRDYNIQGNTKYIVCWIFWG